MTVDSHLHYIDDCGFPVGIETYVPSETAETLATVIMLHGRDGPDGVAGDRSYRDIAMTIASAGFRVLLPRYFKRTRHWKRWLPKQKWKRLAVRSKSTGCGWRQSAKWCASSSQIIARWASWGIHSEVTWP